LRDCVIQLPTGAGGANTSPGGASGVTVLGQCVRPITVAESLLAANSQAGDTTGATTARVMTFEGRVDAGEVGLVLYNEDGTPRN
jgi:hypothetical protein